MDYRISQLEEGKRLDVVVAARAGLARAQARRWIDSGRVLVNDVPMRASHKVVCGDTVLTDPPDPEVMELRPQEIPLLILYEDSDVIVIDKEAGLVVHPGPGHPEGTLVNALLHHCDDLSGIGGVLRPGIVHRLDRGTSGVLVVAKHDSAHEGLAEQFRQHSVERTYAALVRGIPRANEGIVEKPIGRHPHDRKRMSTRGVSMRQAFTKWQVKCRYEVAGASLLEVTPRTGRTHQIRVHLASAGLPIVGDPVYGVRRGAGGTPWAEFDRPALHAMRLGFMHPINGVYMDIEARLPKDFISLVKACSLLERKSE